jgi:hypothetical protein
MNQMMQSNMMQNNMMQNNMTQPNMMMGGQPTNSGPRISEMGGGTPISHLRKDVANTKATSIKDIINNDTESTKSIKNIKSNNMKHIVDDINNDSDIGPRKILKKTNKKDDMNEKDEDEEDKDDEAENSDDEEIKEKTKKKKKSNYLNFSIPEMLKDPVLIWLIYMLMSQNFFKNLIGKYLTSINPNEEGVVTFTGVAMYGLILVALFTLIKFILKIILNKY